MDVAERAAQDERKRDGGERDAVAEADEGDEDGDGRERG